ncbi:26S proteasome regulatory subunit RPN2, putative [Plasmodium chabaudi chabaudi]|uniref:26S proteasome regulatory subunit RPN2, putative n=1 Tax=Plasmodium chabaudi chabaudi TaxID=31271 RepID=A0A4V0KAK6_PLACU|nr:26S proteasome regulatory subunit RPN2, putative [Plasmodium chabaudi chabaudi]VTZ70295.1 26S proteasome regulatory subunit RPN2, putative [Plasmodium chabaudi chabaudi]|eukprot:XP_016654589.1 26S proteasome regulatory subunit, putative [Plasmodium chabaudi chabaudi]
MDVEKTIHENDIVTSASGVIALLNEEDASLKIFGLEKLNSVVDIYWPELADYIFKIEELCEDEEFSGRELANLVASKVYYHLEKYPEALKYALCAGKLFNINEKSQYIETMLAKCIEKYVEIREKDYEGVDPNSTGRNNAINYSTNENGFSSSYTLNTNYNNIDPEYKKGKNELNTQNNIEDHNRNIYDSYDYNGKGINANSSTKNNNILFSRDNENDKVKEENNIFKDDLNNDINKKMEIFVDDMLEICIKNNSIKEALGVALDARRLDKVEYIILNAPNKLEILQHSISNERHINTTKKFRNDFFKLLVKIYLSMSEEEIKYEYVNLCECLFYINDYKTVAEILLKLIENYHLMVYQISFDLVDLENINFLKNILKEIKEIIIKNKSYYYGEENYKHLNPDLLKKNSSNSAISEGTNEGVKSENTSEQDAQKENSQDSSNTENAQDNSEGTDSANPTSTAVNTDDKKNAKDNEEKDKIPEDVLMYVNEQHHLYEKIKKLIFILTGKITTSLYIEFLHRNNHADLILLDSYKNVIDSRSSITHHGIVIAHGLMQAGTTCDVFLRSNIEWLSKAVNWAKFSSTASLGVVYKGHVNESFMVLSSHLPYNDISRQITNNINANISQSDVYSESGSLYALGLIHATYNTNYKKVRDFLLSQLKGSNNNEVLQHGCCLGLGLVCLEQNDDEQVYDELKSVMYSDSAVAGESAAYGIGLLKLGSGDEKCVDELLAYAHDTQHEKITRACSISLGFVMFQKEREADNLIEELINDKDAIIRYGGMFTIALAYCGLSNYNKHVIKKLLHFSVSDVSDDVRRAAVIALGFVLCNTPAQVPMFLNLLIESYNPHVRYGAALALGIACAATGNEEAVNMLMPLLTDTTDFVRQSAFISLGLIFQQSNENVNPNFKKFKDEIMKILSDKHEDIIAKFGATVGLGLLDICGRNAISTFFTRRANIIRPQSAVGFCLFCQLWYWFPLIHMISLTFLPTCLIGLTEDLKVPKNFTILSTKNQAFDYPSFLSKEKVQEKKETVTAILSTTDKRKSLKLKKQKNENKLTKEKNPQDDSSSVLSDGKSMKNLEILSTAATIGQSSHVSHAESVEGSANDENSNDHQNDANQFSQLQRIKKSDKSKSASLSHATTVDMKNPCRVIKTQEKYIEYPPNSRFKPIISIRKSGFIMLSDTTPTEPFDFIEPKLESGNKKEVPPFEPFTWKDEN